MGAITLPGSVPRTPSPPASSRAHVWSHDPVVHRLSRLAAVSATETGLSGRLGRTRVYRCHAQILPMDEGGPAIRGVNDGWACLNRVLADGRRQIHCLFVPGDVIVQREGARPSAGLIALTRVTLATFDDLPVDGPTGTALQRSAALDREHLLNQIVRLGRQHAYERIAHLFMELRDRLLLAGVGQEDRFEMPLTQEVLADVLGLTSVHINRTLQLMRAEGMIVLSGRTVELPDPAALAQVADYQPATLPDLPGRAG